MSNQKGYYKTLMLSSQRDGRFDGRTNERIIGRNDEEIHTPRHISYDWGVVKLILVQM